MEMRKMEIKNKEVKKVEVKSIKRLNINYIDFIKELKNRKLVLENSNLDSIKSLYSSLVKLRFSNIERVNSRINRCELNKELVEELKERNMEIKEFREIGDKLINLSSEKIRNYRSIEL
jgi:hypothetical protein